MSLSKRLINTGGGPSIATAPMQVYLNGRPCYTALPKHIIVYYDDGGTWVEYIDYLHNCNNVTITIDIPIGVPLKVEHTSNHSGGPCDTSIARLYKSYSGYNMSSITLGDFTDSGTYLQSSYYWCGATIIETCYFTYS